MSTVQDPTKVTSIETYTPPECAVRFRKWTKFLDTAYQRHQQAGFTRAQADLLVKAGRADIVEVNGIRLTPA